ncbi:MAG: DPP IV N-terminal domain-containing protein [Planctomycetaceae bacterium]
MQAKPFPLFQLMLCLVLSPCASVIAEDIPSESLLTIDRIFGTKEFEVEPIPQIQWSEKASAYYTLDDVDDANGQQILKHNPETGESEVLVPASAFTPQGEDQPIKVEGFAFSPDESKVLIYTNSTKVWRQNTRGDYWVLDLSAKSLSKLGGVAPPSSLMFAKFSPDGTRVAYVHRNNIYVQNLSTWAVTQLTVDGSKTLINGTGDWVNEEELSLRDCYRWSPDGKSILFWQFDTSGVGEFHLIHNNEGLMPRIQSFAYPKVGEKNSATRLGVVPASGGKTRWLSLPGDPREHYLPRAEWTPNGSAIFVQQFNRLQNELTVWTVDPKSGTAKFLMKETDEAWLENENPFHWLNKGKNFLWVSERSGWRHVYLASASGKELVPVTQGEFDVLGVEAIDEEKGWLYYAASPENATQRYLFRVKLDGTGTEQLSPTDKPGWHTYSWSHNAKWAVHTYSTFTTPPVVELVQLSNQSVARQLEDNQKLRDKLDGLIKPEIEFGKVDIGEGMTLDGWSIKPSQIDADAKLPLVIYVYGEPHGQTVRDAWQGSRGLWHWMLAQQGFVIASVDNRGTNVPRGREWRKCVHRKIGITAPQEQARAVNTLLQRWPFVDKSRVGVWGWSGGGSMSLNGIFRYPELYRTAIAIAPVADQRLYDTIYQERYMGVPSDNTEGFRDGSPMTHARNLRGNLLLIHGTGDDNCHYQATERLMNELIANGKHFTAVPYPDRSHSVSEGANTRRHLYATMTKYFQDNLQSPGAPLPQSPHEIREVRGWVVHISKVLIATQPELTEQAIVLLDKQLEEVTQVVPKPALEKLRQVPLYFMPEYPGVGPRAEYHPGAGWLRDNGRDPAMAKGVEFTNIRIFQEETNRMPNFTLHELAHAYHDRFLPDGFGNEPVQIAYARAKSQGLYERVERHYGNGRPNTFEKAYALTNPQEYFAETTEAFFSRNDFFPFDKQELARHDAEMFDLLEQLWK